MSGLPAPSPNSMQQDGPDYYNLFIRMSCLTVPTNTKDIVRYLRFFKDQDGYEMYLKHYLPKLPKDIAAEFEKPKAVKVEEPVPAEAPAEAPKVKKTRKSKSSPSSDAI